jgi:hypothetical protein
LIELGDSLQHGFQHLLDLGPVYLIVQGLVILVCFRALSTENRRTQGIIAVGFLGGIIAWFFTRLIVI